MDEPPRNPGRFNAFPVQQAIVALHAGAISATLLTVYAVPCVLLLAWLSWRYVEKPALGVLRHRRAAVREPGAA